MVKKSITFSDEVSKKWKAAERRLILPVGVLEFPYLFEPDSEYSDPPAYKTTIVFEDGKAIREVEALLDTYLEEALADCQAALPAKAKLMQKAPNPIKEHTDYQTKAPDGKLKLTVKIKSEIPGKDGKVIQLRPLILDSKLKPIKNPIPLIGAKAQVKVSFRPPVYISGTNLVYLAVDLSVVKVISKGTDFGGGADLEGFEAEEDGFSVDDETTQETGGTQAEPQDADDLF